jgi:transcriptional regulator with XRE-family HTH domain
VRSVTPQKGKVPVGSIDLDNQELQAFLKQFGSALKVARKQMGMSQVNAAQTMGIDYRHYQNIEGGKINLRLDTFLKLVKFYKLEKTGRPFDVNTALNLVSSSLPQVEGEGGGLSPRPSAGVIRFDRLSKTILEVNDHLVRQLGYRTSTELVGRTLGALVANESLVAMEGLLNRGAQSVGLATSVALRAQPPAHPIAMMAVLQPSLDQITFIDRRAVESSTSGFGFVQLPSQRPEMRAV